MMSGLCNAQTKSDDGKWHCENSVTEFDEGEVGFDGV